MGVGKTIFYTQLDFNLLCAGTSHRTVCASAFDLNFRCYYFGHKISHSHFSPGWGIKAAIVAPFSQNNACSHMHTQISGTSKHPIDARWKIDTDQRKKNVYIYISDEIVLRIHSLPMTMYSMSNFTDFKLEFLKKSGEFYCTRREKMRKWKWSTPTNNVYGCLANYRLKKLSFLVSSWFVERWDCLCPRVQCQFIIIFQSDGLSLAGRSSHIQTFILKCIRMISMRRKVCGESGRYLINVGKKGFPLIK